LITITQRHSKTLSKSSRKILSQTLSICVSLYVYLFVCLCLCLSVFFHLQVHIALYTNNLSIRVATRNQSSGIIRHASSIRFLFPLRKSLNSKPITHTHTHTYTQYTSKEHTQTQSKAKRDEKHILGATNRQQKRGKGGIKSSRGFTFYQLPSCSVPWRKEKSRENEVPSTQQR
jgi:hypothetical protein